MPLNLFSAQSLTEYIEKTALFYCSDFRMSLIAWKQCCLKKVRWKSFPQVIVWSLKRLSIHPSILYVCMLWIPEKEWRDKQKSVDTLKDTIERQKKDLERVRKEMGDKEMLCSVLRVCLFQWKPCLLVLHAFCTVI